MCRIWGVSYNDEPEAASSQQIASYFYANLVHGGPDAWGWMQNDGKDVSWYRQPGPADTRSSRRLIRQQFEIEPVWMVGHVRKATHGKPNYNGNNHPIRHENILGVHNGKLRNHEDILAITGRVDGEAIVDSEAIFAAVNKWGHAPGLRKVIGDMVAVYVDLRKPRLLHMARSYNRSISIGWTERGNLFFASERAVLLGLEKLGVKFTGYSFVKDMRHLVIKNGQIIYRHTYGIAPVQVQEPDHAPRPSRMGSLTSLMAPDDDAITDGILERARGRIEDQFVITHGRKLASGAVRVNSDLYYYNGRLMTADEYVDMLADEIGWGDDDW